MTKQTRHWATACSLARQMGDRYASRFNITIGLTLIVLTIGEVVLARRVHLEGISQLLNASPGLLLVLASLAYCERRPLPRLIDPCELVIWAVLSSNVLTLMVQLAARSPYPLTDARLAMLDRDMHFDTARIAGLVAHSYYMQKTFAHAYAAIPLLVFAAILVPPFFQQRLACRRYLVAVVLSTIFTSVLFARWPACGPWTTEALRPTAEQAAVTARLLLLKSAPLVRLDLEHTAIVSFPSFHVVLALLSAIALNGVPRVRMFAWVLAVLTCVSTITTGWHYGFDLLGGLAVTTAGWLIAKLVLAREEKTSTAAPIERPLPNTTELPEHTAFG